MYLHVEEVSSTRSMANVLGNELLGICRERRMFLCDGVFSARLRRSASPICRRHMSLSWYDRASQHALSRARSCDRHVSLFLAVVKTLSPASTLPWQSAVQGVDSFWTWRRLSVSLVSGVDGIWSVTLAVSLPTHSRIQIHDYTRNNNIAFGSVVT
jgi:hypothetical protein